MAAGHCGVECREPSGCEGQGPAFPSPEEEQIEQDLLSRGDQPFLRAE